MTKILKMKGRCVQCIFVLGVILWFLGLWSLTISKSFFPIPATGTVLLISTFIFNKMRESRAKKLREDEAFPLDKKRQLYARIVKDGILLTHKANGDE